MEKHIILFLILVVSPLSLFANQGVNLDLTLPQEPFDFEQIEEDSILIQEAQDKRLRIFKIKNEPTKQTLRTFYILNFIDMSTSYYMTSNHPHVKEANFLLPEKPTAAEFIIHKSVLSPIIAANLEEGQMILTNWLLAGVIIRNIYLYETTSRCAGFNYHHVTGVNVAC